MRSPTMWLSKAGVTLGYEGNGCCPLNCTHVYGYTTLLERLYPDFAKDMRVSDFVRNYSAAAGGCTMRFGEGGWAIDGALACVIKTYLVVRQADGKGTWLPKVWPNVKAQMAAIETKFDIGDPSAKPPLKPDGVFRTAQQNTYDTSMDGPNTFIGSYWVTANKAMAAMATLLGDTADAAKYAAKAKQAAANYEKLCYSEKFGYYQALVTLKVTLETACLRETPTHFVARSACALSDCVVRSSR